MSPSTHIPSPPSSSNKSLSPLTTPTLLRHFHPLYLRLSYPIFFVSSPSNFFLSLFSQFTTTFCLPLWLPSYSSKESPLSLPSSRAFFKSPPQEASLFFSTENVLVTYSLHITASSRTNIEEPGRDKDEIRTRYGRDKDEIRTNKDE